VSREDEGTADVCELRRLEPDNSDHGSTLGSHGTVAISACGARPAAVPRRRTAADPVRLHCRRAGGRRVNEILADSRGSVWFCTPEGLPHRSANTMLETSSGDFLVGTPRGLCQFRGLVESSRHTFPETTHAITTSPAWHAVRAAESGASLSTGCSRCSAGRDSAGNRYQRLRLAKPLSRSTMCWRMRPGSVGWRREPVSTSSAKMAARSTSPWETACRTCAPPPRWTGAISTDSISSYRAIPVWQSRGSRPSNAGSTLNTGSPFEALRSLRMVHADYVQAAQGIGQGDTGQAIGRVNNHRKLTLGNAWREIHIRR